MRHCAFLFRLFWIGYACRVFFSACTQASSLKESDDESPRADQRGSDGKHLLRADDPEPISAEERGINAAVESIEKVKASKEAEPDKSLMSRLDSANWKEGLWAKPEQLYASSKVWKSYKESEETEKNRNFAIMAGVTPLYVKNIKNAKFRDPDIPPARKDEIRWAHDGFIVHYFYQLDGLVNFKPDSQMGKWDESLKVMSPMQRLAARTALSRVRTIIAQEYSIEKMISLDVSPILYMRVLDRQGVFKDAIKNKATIDRLVAYTKIYKESFLAKK